VRPRDGSVPGVEALLRWRHPEKGLISSVEFIPSPRRTG
jgi:EAL domain-containing protein (putative c-di-GMP-specific phosphodiesterase class I)